MSKRKKKTQIGLFVIADNFALLLSRELLAAMEQRPIKVVTGAK
ncbi:hypothetical protein [Deinococcus hopiensis]|uniref:Uncharacterized protein n=1 Tax=Deinococcus hopiensis KR-140 TaxID=695939 RepID=A0A1W1UXI2_9DEIO|nr:hypothetical protein [Deinococcus hopiensis]SMB85787.1 hypothetical protein SAMN00790413_03543 [Deinococcus hopiensis KR-140]